MSKLQELKAAQLAALKLAREIHLKGEKANRDLTGDEQVAFEAAYELAQVKTREIDAYEASEPGRKAEADRIRREEIEELARDHFSGGKSGGGFPTSPWAAHVMQKLRDTASGLGTKALLTGEITTPAMVPGVPGWNGAPRFYPDGTCHPRAPHVGPTPPPDRPRAPVLILGLRGPSENRVTPRHMPRSMSP